MRLAGVVLTAAITYLLSHATGVRGRELVIAPALFLPILGTMHIIAWRREQNESSTFRSDEP